MHIFYNSIRQKPLLMLEVELEFSSSFSFHIGHFGFFHCGGETSLPQNAHCCVFQLATKSWMNERGKSRFFHKTFKSSFLRVCAHFHSLYPSLEFRSLRANLSVVPFYRWFCSQTFPRRHIFCEFLLDRQIFGARKSKDWREKTATLAVSLGPRSLSVVFVSWLTEWLGVREEKFLISLNFSLSGYMLWKFLKVKKVSGENFFGFIKLRDLVREWSVVKVSQLLNYYLKTLSEKGRPTRQTKVEFLITEREAAAGETWANFGKLLCQKWIEDPLYHLRVVPKV